MIAGLIERARILRLPPAVLRPIEGPLNRWYDAEPSGRAVWVLLAVFVALWTTFQIVSYASIDLHPDLVEVFGWGMHPSAGYYKHPPLGALMAGTWFAVFPVADWSFHLLAMINAAVALYAVDLIARRYLSGEKRLMVLLLLCLMPFYQFHGQRFASNQTLLSTWPIATYCFLRAFETRAVGWSIAVGVAAALAILGKYYSVFLVAGFVVAALVHPGRVVYLRSASPWISAAAGLLVLAPHLHWLVTTGFQPFGYARSLRTGAPFGEVMRGLVRYMIGAPAYVLLPFTVVLLAARPDWKTLREVFWPASPERRMLVVLLAVPLLLPALTAPFMGALITALWTMSAWFLLPIVLLSSPAVRITRPAAVAVAAFVLGVSVAIVAASPAVAWARHTKPDPNGRSYYRLISEEMTRLWHRETRRPLAFVTGNADFAAAASFYSDDRPSFVPEFRFAIAPWTPFEEVRREGWMAVCPERDHFCLNDVKQTVSTTPGAYAIEIQLVRTFWGRAGEPGRFVLGIFPPADPSAETD